MTLKMTKPAMKLVRQLMELVIKASWVYSTSQATKEGGGAKETKSYYKVKKDLVMLV